MPATVVPVPGVLADGSAPVVALAMLSTIHVARGTNTDVRVTVVNSAGNPVDLTGATATLSVKQYPDDPLALLTKSATIGAPTTGVADFLFVPGDTSSMPPGQYIYDVKITFADSTVAVVVPVSAFVLDPTF